MYKKMSYWFTRNLIQNGIVKNEEKEVYEYSFEVFISTFIIIVVISIIALITNRIRISLMFALGFILARKTSGGYHAKNHTNCFITTISNYLVFLFIVSIISIKHLCFINIILIILSAFLIYFLAPVEDRNKPLSIKERKRYQLRSKIYVMILIMSYFLLARTRVLQIESFSLIFGTFSVSIYLLLGRIKNIKTNPKEKEVQI